MILALILATSLFLLSVGSHLVILNAGHTLLEQNCSLLHKLGIALLVLFSHLTVAAFFAAGFWIGEELGSIDGIDLAAVDRAMLVVDGTHRATELPGGHRLARTDGVLRIEPRP